MSFIYSILDFFKKLFLAHPEENPLDVIAMLPEVVIEATPIDPKPILPQFYFQDIHDSLVKSNPYYSIRLLSQIKQCVFHHTADNKDPWYHARMQQEKFGKGNCYHVQVDANANIYLVNPIEYITYGAANHNTHSVHICLIGDFTNYPPGELQLQAAAWAYGQICAELGRNLPTIRHGDIRATACPGHNFPWQAFLQILKEAVQKNIIA